MSGSLIHLMVFKYGGGEENMFVYSECGSTYFSATF